MSRKGQSKSGSSKSKRTGGGGRPPSPSVAGPYVYGAVVHRPGRLEITIPGPLGGVEPERGFYADCGIATTSTFGGPELQVGQARRRGPPGIDRLVIVKYEADVFRDRAQRNEEFRQGLEEYLAEDGTRGTPGEFDAAFERPERDSAPTAAIVHADAEYIVRSGGQASIIFLATSPVERHQAIMGTTDRVRLVAPLQVDLTARALADLLRSWKDLADQVGATDASHRT